MIFGVSPVDWYVIGLVSMTSLAWMVDLIEEPMDVIIIMIMSLLGPIITAFAIIAAVLRLLVWFEDWRRPPG